MSEKREVKCPMCNCTYLNIARHFKAAHRCANLKERSILVKWATGHINIRSCPCPVLGCKYNPGHHLDRHITNTHSELSDTHKEEMLARARTVQARLLLGELRASMSTPAMVSDFDKRELEDLYAPAGQVVEQQQPSSTRDPVCCSAACAEHLKSYKSELDTMAKIRVDLESRLEQQQQTITTLKRFVASLRRQHAPTAQKVKRKRTEVEEASTSCQLEPQSGGETQVTEEQETTTSAAPSNLPTPKEVIQIPGAKEQIVLPTHAIGAEEEKETAGPASFSWSAGTGKGNLMRRIILPESMGESGVFCPMFKRTYVAMSHHLKRSHRVTNLQEREILLKQASGRVNIRNIPCPVSGCTYNKGRCDKHLGTGHPELTDTIRTTYINVAKEKTKRLLMELRATNPVPPMASALDLGSEDEEGADVGSPHAAPSFDCGGCRSLALENEVLKNELAKLRSSYKALHKRLRRVLKGKGLVRILLFLFYFR
ncbi:uncharacterized protein LOC124861833 isoform X1 [Girardinichthys multiradiatus]|uniref:uncharacterized protein LOC124861833 isoform X1 n=1 Tax=Girardinichthys multiradiatus TaxID=208333 RepID=UPI001FACD6F1|nr:uncharacterized protein LOC124861833 isoform X1 [Girardinichthys multiradiatus]